MIALPNRYKAIVTPFGVVGAIVVEAKSSPRGHLEELGKRPQIYIKLSEVVHRIGGEKVSTDLSAYKDWLDELWSIFGEDRVMFGSDWPQSEGLEFNSYPKVISVARALVATKGPAAI